MSNGNVRAYWWRGAENFGDALTPVLLDRLLGLDAEWENPPLAQVVVMGSILSQLPARWTGTILGVGSARAGVRAPAGARVLALRGPLTATDTPGDYALGDPGLLVPDLVPRPEPRWDLGVVPHWSNRSLRIMYEQTHPDARIIDVAGDPLTVVAEIASCRRIVTSSLHGLVVADAYGIPAEPVACKRTMAEGQGYKFRDHAAALGLQHRWEEARVAPRDRVEAAQTELREAFDGFRQ